MHRKKTEWWPRYSGEGTLMFNAERAPVREDKKVLKMMVMRATQHEC